MKNATIGQRRHLLQLLVPQVGNDDAGQPLTGYNLVTTLKGRVATINGAEPFSMAARQFTPEATHVVYLENDLTTRTISVAHWFGWTPPGLTVPTLLDVRWTDPGERMLDGIKCVCIERVGQRFSIVGVGAPTAPSAPSYIPWQLYSPLLGNLTGAIDGSNKTFTLTSGVIPDPAVAQVHFNGVKLAYGIGDYSFSGNQVILSDAPNPASGDTPADTIEVYA